MTPEEKLLDIHNKHTVFYTNYFICHVCDKESNLHDYQLIRIFKHSLYFYNPVQFFGMKKLLLVPAMGSEHNPRTRMRIVIIRTWE
jgi:hypothetical protein